MPTYEYQCKACGHTLEEFHSITEPPLTRCPKCETDNLARVMGTGAGLIFRGTGFYLTDYKKSGGPAAGSGGQSPSTGSAAKASDGGAGGASADRPDGKATGGKPGEKSGGAA